MSGGGDQVGAWHASTFSTRFIINYPEIKSCYKLYLCKFCGIAIKYTQAQDHDYDSNFTQRECSCYIAYLCWQEVDCLTEIKLVYQILGQLFVWLVVVVMCIHRQCYGRPDAGDNKQCIGTTPGAWSVSWRPLHTPLHVCIAIVDH